ncbi:unnamed protein product [Closterium sp. NIES-53]
MLWARRQILKGKGRLSKKGLEKKGREGTITSRTAPRLSHEGFTKVGACFVLVDDSSRAAALLRALAGGNGQLEGGVESGANGVPSAEQQDSIQRTIIFANDVESVDAIGRLLQRHLSSSAAATSAVVADDMAVGGAADVAAARGADVAWCAVYHKDVPLDERERTLRRFQEGGGVLVCTDAASRGIDVEHVSHVVQVIARRERGGLFGGGVDVQASGEE